MVVLDVTAFVTDDKEQLCFGQVVDQSPRQHQGRVVTGSEGVGAERRQLGRNVDRGQGDLQHISAASDLGEKRGELALAHAHGAADQAALAHRVPEANC